MSRDNTISPRPSADSAQGGQRQIRRGRFGGAEISARERTVFTAAACLMLFLVGLVAQQTGAPAADLPALDYDYFKTMVQPIFLAKRPGHARCIVCHGSGTPLRLQPLAPGQSTWTEEESQKNFAAVRRVVTPGDPRSLLLIHPLEDAAGGDFFHNGGKHWSSQDDPEWQTLRAWVMGSKIGAREH